jgi:hypothetical protein
MDRHEVRVKTVEELDAWLRGNISLEPGWIYAICPDKAARDLSVLSELKTKGWKINLREWDYDSEGDPRATCYWLVGEIASVLGCLELLEENEMVAKEKVFQFALKAAKRSYPMVMELQGKLNSTTNDLTI